jgi:hypothetical protein
MQDRKCIGLQQPGQIITKQACLIGLNQGKVKE